MTAPAGPTTPVMSDHARERCVQMGLTTKEVKRAWQDGTVDYPGVDQHRKNRIRISPDGRLAVVYRPLRRQVIVVTVLWSGIEFERPKENDCVSA